MANARNWSEMQARVRSIEKAVEDLPAPPRPNDSWGEKVNAMNRVVEGLREQCRSEVEQEDLRAEREEDE